MKHDAAPLVRGSAGVDLESNTWSRPRNGTDHLRVLIANERKDRLALVAPIVVSLGHEVIAGK